MPSALCGIGYNGHDSGYYAGGNGGGYSRSGYSGLIGYGAGNGAGGYYGNGFNSGLSGDYAGVISSYPYNRNVGYSSSSGLTTNYNPQSGYYY